MERYNLEYLEVLILNENLNILKMLRNILKALGVEKVRTTTDPDKAYDMFTTEPADLIFADWVPGHDELKFLKSVRTDKDSPDPHVPIIVVSSYSEKLNVIAARDLGMTEFLAMPISGETVYKHICSVVQDSRPFIRAPRYFGPDRRRRKDEDYEGPERRKENAEPED